MRPSLPDRFVMLQQEGYLFQACLSIGLTQLQKSTSAEKGSFYAAFFNLSIGTERLLKTILLIDHFIDHKFAFPSAKKFKTYGHDLNVLYQRVKAMSQKRTFGADFSTAADLTNKRILHFLSEFAMRARYSNLDNLEKGIRNRDPLSSWNNILKRIFETDVPESKKRKVLASAKFYAPLLEQTGSLIKAGLQ